MTETSETTAIRAITKRSRPDFGAKILPLALVLAAIFVFLFFTRENFATAQNLNSILFGVSIDFLVVVGFTYVMVMREIDLSVGSVFALTGTLTGTLLVAGWGLWPAAALALAVAACIGFVNGFLVVRFNINSLMLTIGTMLMVRGLANVLANNLGGQTYPRAFRQLARTNVFDVRLTVVLMVVLVLAAWVFQKRSALFRKMCFIGENVKSATVHGIRVGRIKILTFVVSAVMAGVAGIFTASRITSADVRMGVGLEFVMVTAAIIGGASLYGGRGDLRGSLLGLLLLALVLNGMIMYDVEPVFQQFVIGFLLIVTVAFDTIMNRRSAWAMTDIRKTSFLRAHRLEQEVLTLVVSVAMAVALALMTPAFLDANNIASLQTSIAPNLIVALGMMTLFMIGRFDLSIGAAMGLSGIVAAIALDQGLPVPVGVAAGLATGLAIGAFNGAMVAWLGINHLIVTLGVLYMTRGVIEVIMVGTKLAGFTTFPPAFLALGQWSFAGISGLFLFALFLCLCFELFLRLTVSGRNLLFLGGHPQAAVATGLHRRRIEFWAFVLSGGLAALAGVLMTSRVGMANRYMGEGLEMQIFIACLVGGGSIAGGKGSYVGALVGVTFIALLTNAFNLLQVPSEWQAVVIGGVLVLVVVIDATMALRKAGRPWRNIFGLRPSHLRA